MGWCRLIEGMGEQTCPKLLLCRAHVGKRGRGTQKHSD